MRWLVVVAVGCGRIGFDPGSTSPIGDGTVVDNPPGSIEVMAAVVDTSISAGGNPNANFGGSETVGLNNSDAILIRPVLDLVPPGSTVLSGALTLVKTNPGNPGTILAFRLVVDWDEGTDTGNPGTANANERKVGVPWSGVLGGPPDSDATPAGSASTSSTPGSTFQLRIDTAVVQAWVDSPSTNFGFRMTKEIIGGNQFGSSENANGTFRPVFTVVYLP